MEWIWDEKGEECFRLEDVRRFRIWQCPANEKWEVLADVII